MSTDQSVDLDRRLAGPIIVTVADTFDLSGILRRIRRMADLSQRQLAAAAGLSVSAVAHAETGTRDLAVSALARAAGLAGLRLALLDEAGDEVLGMHPGAVRDRAGRRFPAHLDTMLSEERISRWEHRPQLVQPTYTFDRRRKENLGSRSTGRSDDHLLPKPGDSPAERADRRRAEQWRKRTEERERRFLAGESARLPDPFACTCPPRCDDLDDRSGPPVHAEECECSCDLA